MRRLILDAVIVIRFAVETDPDHRRVLAKLDELLEAAWEICVAPQAIRESWNVLTRPALNGGYGWSPQKAERTTAIVLASFLLLEETPDVFRHWQRLVAKHGIIGKSVHDANVVATGLAHGATHLLTLNERDFRRYAEVETLSV